MKRKMKAKKKERIIRLDFDTNKRTFIEIYEISPDGSQVRTRDGWAPSYRPGVITQRPMYEPGFMTKKQIERAICFERELLKEKKYKGTASYMAAVRYPIKKWLGGEL